MLAYMYKHFGNKTFGKKIRINMCWCSRTSSCVIGLQYFVSECIANHVKKNQWRKEEPETASMSNCFVCCLVYLCTQINLYFKYKCFKKSFMYNLCKLVQVIRFLRHVSFILVFQFGLKNSSGWRCAH